MKEYLEQLEEWLFRDARELAKREEIYESNDRELKEGTAVVTEIALASHAAARAEIERRRNNYYELEAEIERIKGML